MKPPKARLITNWQGSPHAFPTILIDGMELTIAQAEAVRDTLHEYIAAQQTAPVKRWTPPAPPAPSHPHET